MNNGSFSSGRASETGGDGAVDVAAGACWNLEEVYGVWAAGSRRRVLSSRRAWGSRGVGVSVVYV